MENSPIWMDSSTTQYCKKIEQLFGGPAGLFRETGSSGHERFSVHQICKLFREEREKMLETERISLVSSFLASVLVGDYVGIDVGDASGMNCMQIREKKWLDKAVEYAGDNVKELLGEPVASHLVVGRVSEYMERRYGFCDCEVAAFSGDNLNSVAGLRMEKGDVAVSLGTSDTLFVRMEKLELTSEEEEAHEGHIFCNPISPEGYVALLCFKNGSLAREDIRNKYGERKWEKFDENVSKTPPGNGGASIIHFPEAEIIPAVSKCTYRFLGKEKVEEFDKEKQKDERMHCRAILESQFLSMRLHASKMLGKEGVGRILVTGGASQNQIVLETLSDVFGVKVYTSEQPQSAALGAAYRAFHSLLCKKEEKFVPFESIFGGGKDSSLKEAANPTLKNNSIYDSMLIDYQKNERFVIEKESLKK